MVIIMETRLERNKRLRKEKRFFKIKGLAIFILICITLYGVNIVNNSIVDLNCLENSNLFYYDYTTGKFDLFGKTYLIDLNTIKNLF